MKENRRTNMSIMFSVVICSMATSSLWCFKIFVCIVNE